MIELKEQVSRLKYDKQKMRVYVTKDKYIGGVFVDRKNNEVDYFSIAAIYEMVIDLDDKIKYSFDRALKCKLTYDNYNPFAEPDEREKLAYYYIENIIFRTEILWGLLAQVCNIYWCIDEPINRIYTRRFFETQAKVNNIYATKVLDYFEEPENYDAEKNQWTGNNRYVNEFRNKMTHRGSPSVQTFSCFDIDLRAPALYVLERATADYVKATEFMMELMEEVAGKFRTLFHTLQVIKDNDI